MFIIVVIYLLYVSSYLLSFFYKLAVKQLLLILDTINYTIYNGKIKVTAVHRHAKDTSDYHYSEINRPHSFFLRQN